MEEDALEIDSFIACERGVEVTELPARVSLNQQHLRAIIDDSKGERARVVVVACLAFQDRRLQHIRLAADVDRVEIELHVDARPRHFDRSGERRGVGVILAHQLDHERLPLEADGVQHRLQLRVVAFVNDLWIFERCDREVFRAECGTEQNWEDRRLGSLQCGGERREVLSRMIASVGEQDQPAHVSATRTPARLQCLRQIGGLRDEARRRRRDRLLQLTLFDGLGLPREQKQFEPTEMFVFFEQRLRNG